MMQQQEMAISQAPAGGGSNSSSVQDIDAVEENPPKAPAAAAAAASRSSCSRRPRVREVSSRFMSPVVSSASSSSSSSSLTDLHLSSSFSNTAKCLLPPKHQQQHHHQRSQSVNRRHPPSSPIHSDSESEPLSSSASSNSLIIVRNSLDTPLPGFHHHPTKRSLFASNKLLHLKENGDPHLSHSSSNLKFPPRNTSSSSSAALPIPYRRTDTPTVPRSIQNFPTPVASSRSRGFALAATTAAAKLVQSTGLAAPKRNASQEEIQRNNPTPTKSSSTNDHRHAAAAAADSSVSCGSPPSPSSDTCTITSQRGFCDSPPIPTHTNKNSHPISDFRSSMPEADLLPTMSARILGEDNSNDASFSTGDFCMMAASPCHRSLNSALSSCHQSSSPTKSFSRSSLLTKSQSGSAKSGAICLPPNPSNIKSGMELKKSRKPSNHQDDVHSLRVLHSRYLQWRLANAKAEAAMDLQRIEAEKSLHSVMAKTSAMRESVVGKRIELEKLKRMERLSVIVDSQLPYLAEWAVLEEDYSSCLSGAINAFNDSLTYLPVVGNVRAEATELSESLSSAINVLEAILPNVQNFLPKLQGVDHVISELAGVVSRERAFMEECGALLSKANILQVEECSLRGQLIQLKRGSRK